MSDECDALGEPAESASEIMRVRREIIHLARQSGDPSVIAEALLWRYPLALRLEPEVAKATLEEARALYAQQRMTAGLAHCDTLQARVDVAQGRYAEALFTLRRAIPLLGALRSSARVRALGLEVMGYVYFCLSMYDEAVQIGTSLIEIGESLGDKMAFDTGTYVQSAGRSGRVAMRYYATNVGSQDDEEVADLLTSLKSQAGDEQASATGDPARLVFRCLLMEVLAWLGRDDEAAAVARSVPAGHAAITNRVQQGVIALLLHGPDRCIELMRPLLEPASRITSSERLDLLEILADAYERKADYRAALHATREAMGHRHSNANRKARAQAALLSMELEAERETLRAQQALAHAGKLAAVGQLASSLAHEISQPAAALMLLCEEARSELKAQGWSALAQCLREIEQQAERLRRLVGRMRDFSRDDPVHLEEVLLDQVADEAHRLLRPKLREAGVACTVEVPALIVMTDKERVILSLVNLINNAVDAMRGQQSPAPEVRIVAQQYESGEVSLSVLDNGPGLSDQTKAKVFQPFFTTKAAGQGLGLGLTITREALMGIGARLQADNAEGGGARFTVCLPALAPARVREAALQPS
jgi:signal transduction histidine kinase